MSVSVRKPPLAVLPLLFRFFLAALLALTLIGFAPTAEAATTRGERVRHALKIVRNQTGDPYRYGAAGPNAFDCSGLVYYSYRKAGIKVPRTSSQQAQASRRIKRSNMRRGDLIFFHSGGSVYHVAVFNRWRNGHRVLIHASRSGTPVKRDRIWTNSWFPGTFRR